PGDEGQTRSEQRRQHAAGAEQQPEDRGVGALHRCHHLASANNATDASTVAAQPLRVMVDAVTRRPPTKIIGIVFGMISNQLLAWMTNATSSTPYSSIDPGVRSAASQRSHAASPWARRTTPIVSRMA